MNQCTSRFLHRGVSLRCQHASGHDSVHYNGDLWWPNKRGFPHPQHSHNYTLIGWLIAAIVLTAIIIGFVLL